MIEKTVRLLVDIQAKNSAAIQQNLKAVNASMPAGGGLPTANLPAGATQTDMTALASKAGTYAGIALAVVGAIAGAAAAITGLIMKMNELAKAASPALADQQQRAWNDLYAILGRAFLPVLQQVTEGVRLIADVMQTILPSQGEFLAIARELKPAWDSLREALAPVAQIIRRMTEQELRIMVQMITRAAEAFANLAQMVNRFLPAGAPLQSSVGASGFGVSFTSANEFHKAQIEAALAGGAQERPMNEQQGNSMIQKLGEIAEGMAASIAARFGLNLAGNRI